MLLYIELCLNYAKIYKYIYYNIYIYITMVLHTCNKCNKVFNKKSTYINHLNKKFSCIQNKSLQAVGRNNVIKSTSKSIINESFLGLKNYQFDCIYCHKLLSTKSNYNRHIGSCKIKKELELEKKGNDLKEELFQSLLCQMKMLSKQNEKIQYNYKTELDNIQMQNKKLQDDIQKQNEEIRNLRSSKTINNVNTNCNNTINQTINMLSYKDTDMSHMTIVDYVKCLDRANFCVPQLLENIHFNPDKPENHNIYIPNLKNNLIMLFDGQGWNLHNRDDTIDEIYEDKTNILVDKIEDWEKMGKKIDKVAIRKFNRYLDKKDTPGISNKIKDEIKLILYNKREMVRPKV